VNDQAVPAVSRRTLIKTAAGAGVVAATVGVVGVAQAAAPAAETESTSTGSAATTATSGPIVVHVTDLATGAMEVFAEDSRIQITDTDLAARIARAAR
jgi:hypothetical protein